MRLSGNILDLRKNHNKQQSTLNLSQKNLWKRIAGRVEREFKRNRVETLIFAKDTKTKKEYEITYCLSVADLATDLSREFGYKIAHSPCNFRPLSRDASKEEAYDYLGMLRQEVYSDVISAVLFEKSKDIVRRLEKTAEGDTIQASMIDKVVRDELKGYDKLLSDVIEDIKDEVEDVLEYSGYIISTQQNRR